MSLPASDLTKKPDMRTTMELGAVLPETAEVRDDHLFIGGVDMVELARKEGTALYHADYEPTIANKAGQPREEIVTLCGKHCESGDAVVIDMPLQKADLGDIVCVFGTGAYNMTMASNYNGQPRPAVVFVRDGASRVVTRRETYEDLYQRDL